MPAVPACFTTAWRSLFTCRHQLHNTPPLSCTSASLCAVPNIHAEEEQNTLETKAYGSGLKNLGNTCYMNSTLQCLYTVDGLKQALQTYAPAALSEPNAKLTQAARELFADLQRGGEPLAPFKFLLTMRQCFPQFAQQTNDGRYMQQDAEECWTQVMYALKEQLKVRGLKFHIFAGF
jgi:ubiquitin carboxyl-terminal hydrolase 14